MSNPVQRYDVRLSDLWQILRDYDTEAAEADISSHLARGARLGAVSDVAPTMNLGFSIDAKVGIITHLPIVVFLQSNQELASFSRSLRIILCFPDILFTSENRIGEEG